MTKITVGLMVHNEAAHVEQAIKSIQRQSFRDFELLVGDNASTDGSSGIIAELAKQDKRIVHIIRPVNIGALRNWNDMVTHASGEYFVLAGGHDLWSERYLEKLAACLDCNQGAALAFCKTQWIDSDGNGLPIPASVLDTSGMSRLGKFASLMFANQNNVYGMARVSAMRRTRLQLAIIGSGEIYLQELAQQGDFILVENERWCRRRNRAPERTIDRLKRYQDLLFGDERAKVRFKCFPFLQLMFHYLAFPFVAADIPLTERVRLVAALPLVLVKYVPYVVTLDVRWLFTRRAAHDR